MLSPDLVADFLWGSLFLFPLSLLILLRRRKEIELFHREYWDYLFERWKLVTFLISGGFITLAGPYTSDPTWDMTNGGLMSLFTYLTAPWSVGILFLILKGQRSKWLLLPVFCFWFLAVVWSYDFYLYFRDGFFPEASLENFFLSGLLYLSAGLFWNLEETKEGKVLLSFMSDDWLRKRASRFRRIFWIALPLMLFAVFLTLPLLLEGQF